MAILRSKKSRKPTQGSFSSRQGKIKRAKSTQRAVKKR